MKPAATDRIACRSANNNVNMNANPFSVPAFCDRLIV